MGGAQRFLTPMFFHQPTSICLRIVFAWGAFLACGASFAVEGDPGDEATFFHTEVEPLLRKRCFACHSHEAQTMEGGLALDWRSGWEVGGSLGPTVVAGKPELSILIRAIRHEDDNLKMPEDKLSDAEIAVLMQWVQRGAFDDRTATPDSSGPKIDNDWWSLRPLVSPTVPNNGSHHPIDAFITEKLHAAGISPSPPADARTLIQRLYYDLIGLPPTFEEVESFAADSNLHAYHALVDRLLASPHYGERWARHWLDTIHFADSHGYEHDVGRDHAWRYRDYVISALNQDTSWEQFIREQLAVDYFSPEQTPLTPALGFLGAGTFDLSTFSTAPVTFDYLDRDDLVTQTMAAFASTTANCARCHYHKFDPISQEDYYALQSVFSGVLKGDVAFDEDPEIARERRRLQGLLVASQNRDAAILLADGHQPTVQTWLDDYGDGAQWKSVKVDTFISVDGATLTQTEDGTLLASDTNPDQDTYVIAATTELEQVSALRLDVYPHDSLPMKGPGRCQNGNLHLSEVDLHVFEPNAANGQKIKFRSASADFNQADWGIERAIDGNPKTAWGIHPAVGEAHHAVFELAEPLTLKPDAKLVVSLRQLHGGSHLIGAFRISVSADDAAKTIALPSDVTRALKLPATQRSPDDHLNIAAYTLRRASESSLQQLPPQVYVYAAAPVVKIPTGNGGVQNGSVATPKPVHVLQRGDFYKPQKLSPPGALSTLTHAHSRFELLNPNNESERRAALANWLAHPENPLTWRSIVNRVWHYHFARGICDTPSDFGRMGSPPTHPELLDWLAVWFRDEAKGSLKELHRLIVTSKTYCQSSQFRDDAATIDGDNRLLWRQNRQRLDADAIRDYALAASQAINLKMGGPGTQHFKQSKGPQATPALDYADYDWSRPDSGRRSIYRYVWRGIADPFMEAFDFPDLGLLSPVRGFSASSLQALTLYNNPFVLHCSQSMAESIQREITEEDTTENEQVIRCVQRCWLRDPTDDELTDFTEFVREHGLAAFCRLLFNSNEFLFVN